MSRAPRTLTVTLQHREGRQWVSVPDVHLHLFVPERPFLERALPLGAVVLGSGVEADLVCEDARVSRRHCRLTLSLEGLRLEDLGSKNGTLVQGVRVESCWLEVDMEVRLGGASFVVRAQEEERALPLSEAAHFGDVRGASVPMRALFAQLERAAQSEASVLLVGESGTGKERLARALHQASPRAEGPFVVMDCAAISANLLETELFGHEQGAFTGAAQARAGLLEQAHGGTLFLDEVGEVAPELQPRLLRALEAKTVRRLGGSEQRPADVRVVASTQRNLRAKESGFREDLYFRLGSVELRVPPLRERKEDLLLLAEQCLQELSVPRALGDLPPNALELLRAHDWPGNVRELRNTVSRWTLFPELVSSGAARTAPTSRAPFGHLSLRAAREEAVAAFERAYVSAKLSEAGGNVSAAARTMDVSRQFLHRLLSRYELRGNED